MNIHCSDYLPTHEGKLLPIEHCIRGTHGWELHGRLSKLSRREECVIVEKSTFGCPDLTDLLRRCNEVELCSLAINICVIVNAVIARTTRPEARVFVCRDCMASYNRVLKKKALDVMESLQVDVK